MRNWLIGVSLLALGLPVLTGCGDSTMGSVSGTIQIDGQAIEGVEVSFEPQFEGGSPSIGTTDASGHYELMFTAMQEGAQVGKHTVRINATQHGEDGDETVLAKIPASYNEESTVEFEVKPGGNTFDLDVTTTAN